MKPYLTIIIFIFVLGLIYVFWPIAKNASKNVSSDNSLTTITLPKTLTASAQTGKHIYDVKCAHCHGTNAVGQNNVAPPLIHKIYELNHHGDESFQRAVALGVSAHHWPFGNMPPIEGVSRDDVKLIIAYIRKVQNINGII